MPRFMLEGPRPCTILPYITKTLLYWLVSQYRVNNQSTLCTVGPKKRTETYNKDICLAYGQARSSRLYVGYS